MQHEHKKWTRKFQGNRRVFNDVQNPIRHYIEQQIKKIPLADYPNRPAKAVDLSIGDPTISPEFKTNPSNLEILKNNVGKIDGYTNFAGDSQARQSIAKMFPSNGYSINKQNVFLTAGGSLAIWAAIMLLADEGDNFLFPSPSFPLAGVIADSIGLKARFYHLKSNDEWKTNIQEMENLVDDRTKFIYINDPSNPLGSCWSEAHKKQIIQFAKKKNLPIIADQIYEGVTFGQPTKTFAELSSSEVTIFKCSGLTKRWLGPGWRLGWLIVYASKQKFNLYKGPLKGIFNIILMPHTIVQSSIKQILQNPTNEQYLNKRIKIMGKNKEILSEELKDEKYCTVGTCSGALYSTIIMKMDHFDSTKFPNISEFCKSFYAEENVSVFPGKFFNSTESLIRLVISCSNSQIEQFTARLKRFSHKYLKKN